jgi:hypothetical protein
VSLAADSHADGDTLPMKMLLRKMGNQLINDLEQGCQMVYFQTKNWNFGKVLRVWQWKMLVYFMDLWSILRPFHIFYGHWV